MRKPLDSAKSAGITSLLSLLSVFLAYFFTIALLGYLTPAYKGVTGILAMLNFAGTALGGFLCPVFLPLPNRKKPLPVSLAFIVLVILPQFIIRSLGVEVWLGFLPALVVSTLCSGILCPLSYGLFFLTRASGSKNGGKSASLLFTLAMTAGILARYFSVPLLEMSGLTIDPLRTMNFLLAVIKWLGTAAGAFSVMCILAMSKEEREESAAIYKTDWRRIWRLVGISVVFYIINAAVEMRLLPLFHYAEEPFEVSIPAMAAALVVLGFFARPSTGRFLRWFLLFSIVLFILIPCLLLFKEYPSFIMMMSTLLAIFRYSSWVSFTIAIVECYAGSYWFYGLASVIYFTNIFSYAGPIINKVLPRGTEFTVFFIGILAAAFVFLVIRVLLQKEQKTEAAISSAVSAPAIMDIFKARDLSDREIEIASLIVNEGLNNNEIANKLFLAPITVRKHASNIYRKFDVNDRTEFMAVVMKTRNG